MEGGFFLDIIFRKSTTVLELLAGKYKTLLVWRDAFFILNFGLHVVDGVGRFNLERNGLSGQGLDENLHTSTKTEDEMKSGFLLDVVVGKGTTILKLLSSEDETLLIGGDAFFVLNLSLHIVNRVRRLDFQGDRFARKGLNEDLHTSTEAKYKVKGGLLLNVIIRKSATVFELLAREDKALLIGGNTRVDNLDLILNTIHSHLPFFVLDFGLNVVDGIGRLDFQSDGLARQCLYKDLHSSTEAENEMEG